MTGSFFDHQRAEALAQPEPCGYCNALTGQRCVNSNSGDLLEHAPAHWARLKNIIRHSPEVGHDRD